MNETTKLFKPDAVTVDVDGTEYRLVYDLNSFCELEKMYDSIDSILQMLLGGNNPPDLAKVTYCDAAVLADDIKVGGTPFHVYRQAEFNKRTKAGRYT